MSSKGFSGTGQRAASVAGYLRQLRNQHRSPLSVAIQEGNQDKVKSILECGADVNQMSVFCGSAEPPLITAIRFDHFHLVPTLLEYDADVNKLSERRHSALIRACQHNNNSVIEMLLDRQCDVNVLDSSRYNALHWAIKNNNEQAVRLLLEHGANLQQRLQQQSTVLHTSTSSGNLNILRLLLLKLEDVNMMDDNDETALYGAIRSNKFDLAKELLDHGAHVNVLNADFRTPLHIASVNVHQSLDLVQLLLDHDALVNVFDRAQYTPLVLSLRNNFFFNQCNFSVPEVLIRHGISLNDPACQNALEMCIISHVNLDLIKMAVNAGFNLAGVEWVSDFVNGPTGARKAWYTAASYRFDDKKKKELVDYLKHGLRNSCSLQDLSRICLRRHLSFVKEGGSIYKSIQKLPLPPSIIMFLLLEC